MSSANSSFADIVLDADKLLSAVTVNAALLPNIEEHRAPLELSLTEVKALSVRQQTLTADRQKATQDLQAAVARTRDLTMQLRAAIKAKLGVRTEKLVEFSVQPLRKRAPRTSKLPVAQPAPKPPGSTPATTPAITPPVASTSK